MIWGPFSLWGNRSRDRLLICIHILKYIKCKCILFYEVTQPLSYHFCQFVLSHSYPLFTKLVFPLLQPDHSKVVSILKWRCAHKLLSWVNWGVTFEEKHNTEGKQKRLDNPLVVKDVTVSKNRGISQTVTHITKYLLKWNYQVRKNKKIKII